MGENSKLIYTADDEANIREAIKAFLENDGYRVRAFATGDELLEEFKINPCDLVILDVMMPGTDGFTVCVELRKISTVPIIMLTARDSDLDYATGLSLGSDDYFTKPFSPMSLVMRVESIFRRIEFDTQEVKNLKEASSQSTLSFGDLELNPGTRFSLLKGKPIDLTPNEFKLLCYMIENRHKAFSSDELLEAIWGYTGEVETRAAHDTIRRLRKKLDGSNVIIDTIWGFGFRLKVI